jgi:hypothetical protein
VRQRLLATDLLGQRRAQRPTRNIAHSDMGVQPGVGRKGQMQQETAPFALSSSAPRTDRAGSPVGTPLIPASVRGRADHRMPRCKQHTDIAASEVVHDGLQVMYQRVLRWHSLTQRCVRHAHTHAHGCCEPATGRLRSPRSYSMSPILGLGENAGMSRFGIYAGQPRISGIQQPIAILQCRCRGRNR